MRNVHSVSIVIKLHTESQGIVVASILSLHRVLVVADICTTSLPALPASLGFSLRVDDWPHPLIVETVRFHEVDDVESVGLPCFSVCYPEVIPLSVAPSVIVRLEDQVVFELVYLNCSSKIA